MMLFFVMSMDQLMTLRAPTQSCSQKSENKVKNTRGQESVRNKEERRDKQASVHRDKRMIDRKF